MTISNSVIKGLEDQIRDLSYEISLMEEQIYYHQKQINDKHKSIGQLEDRIAEAEMAIEHLEKGESVDERF